MMSIIPTIKKAVYYNGQLLRLEDFVADQDFDIDNREFQTEQLFSSGVLVGLELTNPSDKLLTITCGAAMDEAGALILLSEQATFSENQILVNQNTFTFDLSSQGNGIWQLTISNGYYQNTANSAFNSPVIRLIAPGSIPPDQVLLAELTINQSDMILEDRRPHVTLRSSRVPKLDASVITTGIIEAGRLPLLQNFSGMLDQDQLPFQNSFDQAVYSGGVVSGLAINADTTNVLITPGIVVDTDLNVITLSNHAVYNESLIALTEGIFSLSTSLLASSDLPWVITLALNPDDPGTPILAIVPGTSITEAAIILGTVTSISPEVTVSNEGRQILKLNTEHIPDIQDLNGQLTRQQLSDDVISELTPGSQIFTVNGSPQVEEGEAGDLALDVQTGDYYRKEEGAWVLKGNLKGPVGEAGSKLFTVNGVPQVEEGEAGDLALDVQTGDYYRKEEGVWVLKGNLTGPQGIPGDEKWSENGSSISFITGNVGIGTDHPQTLLHIVGGADAELNTGGYLTLGAENNLNIVIDDNEIMARNNRAISTLHLQAEGGDIAVHNNKDESERFIVKEGGNVGIGTTNPSEKLEVTGTIKSDELLTNRINVLPDGWGEQQKVVAAIQMLEESFGCSVAIDGDWAIVGARHNYTEEEQKGGGSYLFQWDGGSWNYQQKFQGDNPELFDYFGCSVDISEEWAIVGASLMNRGVAGQSGSAYLFRKIQDNWVQQDIIQAITPQQLADFGAAVAICGNWAIVGAPRDDTQADGGGNAYFFHYDDQNNSWAVEPQIELPDLADGDKFGHAVAISGNWAVIGAHGTNNDTGKAYLYHYEGSGWTLQESIGDYNAPSSSRFGISVAIDGDWVMVGAYGQDGYKGRVHSFHYDSELNTWTKQPQIKASDESYGARFGYAVSIDGNRAIVGAYLSENRVGSAYIFELVDNVWTERKKITASDKAYNDQFGSAVAISGNRAIIGAQAEQPNDISGAGSAYFFHYPPEKLAVNNNINTSGVIQVDGKGNSYLQGNLGIGTNNPQAKLHVIGEMLGAARDIDGNALKIYSGKTDNNSWVQYEGNGIYIEIDISQCGFSSAPIVITSLGGSSHHWTASGGSEPYNVTINSFRIYIYKTEITPELAHDNNWHINWMAIGK